MSKSNDVDLTQNSAETLTLLFVAIYWHGNTEFSNKNIGGTR